MELIITNKEHLDLWINERVRLGHDLVAVKGDAPCGSTYSDGDLILRPVNVAWKDANTGEVIDIGYLQEGATPMNITRSDLLPCPFCGHAPELEKVGRDWWRVKHPHVMECLIDDMGFEYPQNDESLAYAISDWNKRAQAEAAPVAEAAAWVTHESLRRLKDGGNGSKGTVPMHAKKSTVSQIPLYTAPPHDAELVELLERVVDRLRKAQMFDLSTQINTYLATLPRT